jgi:hypothetical protein
VGLFEEIGASYRLYLVQVQARVAYAVVIAPLRCHILLGEGISEVSDVHGAVGSVAAPPVSQPLPELLRLPVLLPLHYQHHSRRLVCLSQLLLEDFLLLFTVLFLEVIDL